MTEPRLDQLRSEIDRLDRRMLELLKQRAALALAIGRLKKAAGRPVLDPTREAEILARLGRQARPLSPEAVQNIFKAVIQACRRLEEKDR
ncbi:MAG: chorismate mutase [Candidatus Adiutrix sp.]|jgi:monofunctional chorismate mutase|nr:chorismate mutase [Candidatus Adiutrix sp.]